MSDHRAIISVEGKDVQEHQISHLMREITKERELILRDSCTQSRGAAASELMRADKASVTRATAKGTEPRWKYCTLQAATLGTEQSRAGDRYDLGWRHREQATPHHSRMQ